MKSLTGAVVGTIVLTLTLAMVAYSQDRKPDSNSKPFADGSIVSIAISGTVNAGLYLEDPEIKRIGETWFLVGKVADLPGFPAAPKTLTSWVSMSSITMVHEYKDADELRKAFPIQTQPAS